MNQQQRYLLIIFIVVVAVLVVAIIGVNLSRRDAAPDPQLEPSPAPTAEVSLLDGKTEEEIGAMALEEEENDFVGAFDDVPLEDATLEPGATEEPID